MSIENLRKAVIEKARKEAKKILEDAEKRAEEIVTEAKKRYELKVKKERERTLSRIVNEENMKYIKKIMELNIRLTELKNKILNEIIEGIKKSLSSYDIATRKSSLRQLLREALSSGVIPPNTKVVIKVVKKDLNIIDEVINEEGVRSLVLKIETLSDEYLGGLMIETKDGSIAIDNTYKTRLEKIMPELMKVLQERVLRVKE